MKTEPPAPINLQRIGNGFGAKRFGSFLIFLMLAPALWSCSWRPSPAGSVALPEYVAPDVYTPENVVQAMLQLANVDKDDVVYDLGSGDGRIVIAAAKNFGARGVGIDLDQKQIAIARENARLAGIDDKVTFVQSDIFASDLSEATVVTAFLGVRANARLAPYLESQLDEGARVVSHQFDMPGWYAEKRMVLRDDHNIERKLFMWTMGRHKRPPRSIE